MENTGHLQAITSGLSTLDYWRVLSCLQRHLLPRTPHFVIKLFSLFYSIGINPSVLLYFSNSFTEVQYTQHRIHPLYNSMVWVTIDTVQLKTFPPPQNVPSCPFTTNSHSHHGLRQTLFCFLLIFVYLCKFAFSSHFA